MGSIRLVYVYDGDTTSDLGSITINILAVNDAETQTVNDYDGFEDTTLTVGVIINDVDDTLTTENMRISFHHQVCLMIQC